MNVLVTGGTGVIGQGAIPALLKAGHAVSLLSRHAERDRDEWPPQVHGIDGDVADPGSLRDAARGIDVVLHVVGIVEEVPPERTFQRVNVEGTRNMLAEAERAGVKRFIHVSSLGADRGESPYHESKREAEAEVRKFSAEWVIVRPGNVYGPGDEMISTLLKLVRTSPVVPTVGRGDQKFQPLWYEDLGAALAACVDSPDVAGMTLELAGDEVLTVAELLDRMQGFTRRPTPTLGIPAPIVRLGLKAGSCANALLSLVGLRGSVELPLNESKLTMLLEENYIKAPAENGLTGTLGIGPTPVQEGLRRLMDEIPELSPSEGIGGLVRKRFWAVFPQATRNAEALMTVFKNEVADIMPIDFCAEPGAAVTVTPGATFTACLPLRGHIQIRVEECGPRNVTFMTIEGHPLAAFVRFTSEDRAADTRFLIEVHARAGSVLDWVAERTIAWYFQNRTWKGVLRRLAKRAGCPKAVIHMESRTLPETEAEAIDEQADRMVRTRKRREQVEALSNGAEDSHRERAQRT